IRYGRLVQQRSVLHTQEAMNFAVQELLALVGSSPSGGPPSVVGKVEVDQINIISRWIHRHSDDRAFFPFQHALASEEALLLFWQRVWSELDHAGTLSLPIVGEEDELAEQYKREAF